jgi:hypothetical protein
MKKIVTYSFILAIISSLFISCTEPEGKGELPPEFPAACYVVFRDVQKQDRMANIPVGEINSASNIEVVPSFASKESMSFEILDTRAKELPIDQDERGRLNRNLWYVYNQGDEHDYRVLKCNFGKPSQWMLTEGQVYVDLKFASQEVFGDTEIHILKIPIKFASKNMNDTYKLKGEQSLFDGKNQEVVLGKFPTYFYYFIELDD